MHNIENFVNKLNKKEKEHLIQLLSVDSTNELKLCKDDIKEITISIINQLQGLIKNENFNCKSIVKSNYTIGYVVDSMLKKQIIQKKFQLNGIIELKDC